MNPDAWHLAAQRDAYAREDRIRSERRARLHNAAMVRRRKAKKGGPR